MDTARYEPNKVIPTIQSRCQRFDFGNISPNLIAGQLKSILKQEKIGYEEDLSKLTVYFPALPHQLELISPARP